MKKYQLIAVLLILIAASLAYWTYMNDSQTELVQTENETSEENDAAEVVWKTFVTSSTDTINASFDYPEGSTVEEVALGDYAAFIITKDETWDAVVLIIGDDEKSFLEQGMLAGGATETKAAGDRGTFYTGVTLSSDMLLNGTSQLQQELSDTTFNVFIPTQQPSPGYTSVLIDVDADWSEENFDYFTRTFAFIMR